MFFTAEVYHPVRLIMQIEQFRVSFFLAHPAEIYGHDVLLRKLGRQGGLASSKDGCRVAS
jgi:hypothetical protein